MAEENGASSAVVKALASYLVTNTSLNAVYDDFPNPNQVISLPSGSIMTQNPDFMPAAPYVISKGNTPNGDNKFLVTRVIGDYTFNLQLDIFCKTKFDRHKMLEEFQRAFNPNNHVTGLGLLLDDYYDQYARYSMTGFRFPETEEGSQRGEWRVTIGIIADVRAIVTGLEHLMETIENNFAITDNSIEESPSVDDSELII